MLFFFQAEDGIRDLTVTGVQTCALPISVPHRRSPARHIREIVERLPQRFGDQHPGPGCHVGDRILAERSEEHTSELQSQSNLVCRLLLEKKNAVPDPAARALPPLVTPAS